MNIEALTKHDILIIPLNAPKKLFPSDNETNKKIYHKLLMKWHTDHGGDAEVVTHILQLYQASKGKSTSIDIQARDGKVYMLRYLRQHAFELGDMYTAHQVVAFKISKQYEDFMLNGFQQLGKIRYPNETFRKELERFFPKVERTVETNKDYWVIAQKGEDILPIIDLHSHMGTIPTKHVAWIISSLLNLCCFLELNEMTHNGLTEKTVFISPKNHAAYLLGGWWYATPQDGNLKFLPPEVATCAPKSVTRMKKANITTDLESVRQIARSISGSDAPKPFREFINLPSANTAKADYADWEKVIVDSFGARHFTKLPIQPSDIYGE